MININDIEKQVQEAIAQKIETELSTYDLYSVIEQQINQTVQEKVNVTITGLLNRLVSSNTVAAQVESHMSGDIQEKMDRAVKSRVAQTVTQTDLGTEINNHIAQFVEQRMKTGKLPENFIPANSIIWDGFSMSADNISSGIIVDFTSTGIEDCATDINLTVLDGQVVIENETVTKNLTVIESASADKLTVNRLTVTDEIIIKSGKFVDEFRSLIDDRVKNFHSQPMDLNGAALTSNQVKLLDSKSLGPSVVESNLRKLGRLSSLNVVGETNLAETMYLDNGRVGINTDEPAGVFTAWDEESEFSIRKYKNRTMYIGSTRDSELVIGVNGDAVVAIRKHGIETNSVKIGNITISTGNTEPVHRGKPGDLVVNEVTTTGQPWAWRCIGGETWLPLN